MAIVCLGSQDGGSGSAITTSIPAGSFAVVRAVINDAGTQDAQTVIGTCIDTQGNTYTQDAYAQGRSYGLAIFSATITRGLTANQDAILCGPYNNVSGGEPTAVVDWFSGVASRARGYAGNDQADQANETPAYVQTSAAVASGDLVVGISTFGSGSNPKPWITLPTITPFFNATPIGAAYQTATSAGVVIYHGSAANSDLAIAAYQHAGPGAFAYDRQVVQSGLGVSGRSKFAPGDSFRAYLTGPVAAGELLIVRASCTTMALGSPMTDTQGNTYVQIGGNTDSGGQAVAGVNAAIYASIITTALTTSDTVGSVLNGSSSQNGYWFLIGECYVNPPAGVIQAGAGSWARGASPSVAANPAQLLVAAAATDGTIVAADPGAPWTSILAQDGISGGAPALNGSWEIGAVAAPAPVTFVGAGTVGNSTIPLPSGYQAGDLLLLVGWGDTVSYPIVAPGWTLLAGGASTYQCYGKMATGNETAPYFAGSQSYFVIGNIAAYRGVAQLPTTLTGTWDGASSSAQHITPQYLDLPSLTLPVPQQVISFFTSEEQLVAPGDGYGPPVSAGYTLEQIAQGNYSTYYSSFGWALSPTPLSGSTAPIYTIGTHIGTGMWGQALGTVPTSAPTQIPYAPTFGTGATDNLVVISGLVSGGATNIYTGTFDGRNPISTINPAPAGSLVVVRASTYPNENITGISDNHGTTFLFAAAYAGVTPQPLTWVFAAPPGGYPTGSQITVGVPQGITEGLMLVDVIPGVFASNFDLTHTVAGNVKAGQGSATSVTTTPGLVPGDLLLAMSAQNNSAQPPQSGSPWQALPGLSGTNYSSIVGAFQVATATSATYTVTPAQYNVDMTIVALPIKTSRRNATMML